MTGRIVRLCTANAPGVITVEDGLRLHFQPAAVLEYDIKGLAVGQYVSFDVSEGHPPTATNVVVWKHQAEPAAQANGGDRTTIRYMGFDHADGMRWYEFVRVSPGEDTLAFRVAVNQALFTVYRVPLQEGPDLCRRLLTSELKKRERSEWPLLQCVVTESDMLEHLARRPARELHRQPYHRHPALPAKA